SGGVCNAGTCNPCSQGSSCTTNPNSACRNGYVECGSGSGVCTDGSNKMNGTTCPGGVCNSGSCNPCNPGGACSPSQCTTGTIACGSGSPVCQTSGNVAAGTPCTGGVCNGSGSCVACSTGAPCTTNPSHPCQTGIITCSTGTPVCSDDVVSPNGTPCPVGSPYGGPGQCHAGSCCDGCISSGVCSSNTARRCGLGGGACITCPLSAPCVDGYCEPTCGGICP
ncbi:MAG: hypothetical protein JNJ54_02050, partial [Myxococcaceae bacterium]|nr:hypothetical protein [Myxococcaceae bacterium]